MGSTRKYWQWARDCARWAREAEKPEDREILERMAEAWVHVAKADDDASREAAQELERPLPN
jgi:hypothetical protein